MDTRPKAQERERRREHILNAARDLFAQAGYVGSTMDAVAQGSGFTKRTVYGYFASKDELWCGVLARVLHGLSERFEAVEGESGLARILDMGMAFEGFARDQPQDFLVLTEGKGNPGPLSEGTRGLQELGEAHARMQGAMAEALREGIADGSVRQDLNPEATAVLLALYSTGVLEAVRQSGVRNCLAFDPGSLVASSMAFLGHALRAPDRKE